MNLGTAANWAQILGDIPLAAAVLLLWRKHTCHIHRCWRIQWRDHLGYALCRKHHPQPAPRAADALSDASDATVAPRP